MMEDLFIIGIPLIIAITFHEAAHGYVAYLCGDLTAKRMGRLTLNPIKHMDVFGTFVMPLILYMAGGRLLGYAKPVPIQPNQFFHYRSNLVFVAAAGPIMNILLANASWTILNFVAGLGLSVMILKMLVYSIRINLSLAAFNLIPLVPLDGGRILTALLPDYLSRKFMKLEPFGMWIILLLIELPVLGEYLNMEIDPLGWILNKGVNSLERMLGIR